MAEIFKLTEEQQAEMDAWIESLPPVVREIARKYPPNRIFRPKSNGSLVTVYSICDGTVTVVVSGDYNLRTFARRVFGISPDDLEECALPGPEKSLARC